MSDRDVRLRLYEEYKALDDKYRKLAEKLKPLMLTSSNSAEHKQLLDIGRQLESKLQELQEAFGIGLVPLPPDANYEEGS
jgi:predicted nuclease with TOPRIM domain